MRAMNTGKTVLYILICTIFLIEGRSNFRTPDPRMPELITRWSDDTKTYHLKDSYLELYPLFSKFDRDYFMNHLIPDEPISYRRDPKKTVDGKELKKQVEVFIKELKRHKKEFKHFKTLKSADYNFRTVSGLIIVKFQDYPFVLKFFIKTPESFSKPLTEGFHPRCFFRMGGGINRHLSGFTRIRNIEEIRNRIKDNEYWEDRIDTPRKWFLLPEEPRWIELRGKNIGPHKEEVTELPATYGIIADAIETDKHFSIFNAVDRESSLQFAQYLESRIDAHVDNFMIEKGSLKMVLIDTEHFPTMVGLKEPLKYDNYSQWYLALSCKCFKDNFFRTKKFRRELQSNPQYELHHV